MVRWGVKQLAMAVAGACAVLAVAAGNAAAGLRLERLQWGFDGRAVLHCFNPVTLELSNPERIPFEGLVTMEMHTGLDRAGEQLVEEVYVPPGGQATVRFYPYVFTAYHEWRIRWGGDRDSMATRRVVDAKGAGADEVLLGPPARVVLVDPQSLARPKIKLTQFPEDQFPGLVSALDGLHTVLLDHVPRWEAARRTALVEWVQRGGRLHLLAGPDGQAFPLTEELAALASPLEHSRVGSGWVRRHAVTLADLSARPEAWAAFEREHLPPLGEAETSQMPAAAAGPGTVVAALPVETVAHPPDLPEEDDSNWQDRQAMQSLLYRGSGVQMMQPDPVILQYLHRLIRGQHPWGAIFLLGLVYIGLLVPAMLVLARRRYDYRLIYGGMLAVVAIFGAIFHGVGRRGYGESTRSISLSVARPLSAGTYDVSQWSDVFVERGGMYRLSHAGRGRLYATCQVQEAVRGRADRGGGTLEVDIPPYSSRGLRCRFQASGPECTAELAAWRPEQEVRAVVRLTGLPDPPARVAAVAEGILFAGRAARRDSGWEVELRRDFNLLDPNYRQRWEALQYGYGTPYWNPRREQGETPLKQALAEDAEPLLIGLLEADGASPVGNRAWSAAGAGRTLRLYVLVPTPVSFCMQAAYGAAAEDLLAGRHDGLTLFVFDLPLPEQP